MKLLRSRSIALKLVLLILAVSGLVLGVTFFTGYDLSRGMVIKTTKENAKNYSLSAVGKIDGLLRSAAGVPEALAQILERTPLAKQELLDVLAAAVQSNKDVYGSAIAFEPHRFDPHTRSFAPYVHRKGGGTTLTYLDGESYNYLEKDWYKVAKAAGRPVWSEPYYDRGGGNIVMTTYSVPFHRKEGGRRVFSGVVTADLPLADLEAIVPATELYKTDFGFLVSKNGTFIAHPDRALVMKQTIGAVAKATGNRDLGRLGERMMRGARGFTFLQRAFSDESCWVYHAPLRASGWSLGVVIPDHELMGDTRRLSSVLLLIDLVGLAAILGGIVLIARSMTRPLRLLARGTERIARGDFAFQLPSIRTEDEVGQLAGAFRSMRDELQRYIADLRESTAANERIQSELRIARDIQLGVLPDMAPFAERADFAVDARLAPAKEVGGDFYDFFLTGDRRLAFAIGDVAGKGVPGALFMMIAKALLKGAASGGRSPAEVVRTVNDALAEDNEQCVFVTVFFGTLDLDTGEVAFCNAGHNPPLVCHGDGTVARLDQSGGMALGILRDTDYSTHSFTMSPSDTLLLYTDGVTEAMDRERQMFSLERLIDLLVGVPRPSPSEAVAAVERGVEKFVSGAEQSDDITLLALQYKGIGNELRVGLAARLSEVGRLAREVQAFCDARQLPADATSAVQLALEEVVTNTIQHGAAGAEGGSIEVALALAGDEIVITVEDEGRAFDPLQVPEPDTGAPLEQREPGGLGVFLARKVMDGMAYLRRGEKNVLTMRKRIGGR